MVKYLRSFFRWEYTGWFLAVFIGTGLTLLFYKYFAFAYLFFAAAGLWGIAYWQLHDVLVRKRAALNERKVRKNQALLRKKLFNYRAWRWGVSGLLALVTLTCLVGVRAFQERSELESLHGYLVPANDRTANFCSGPFTPERALRIHLGKFEVFATVFPYTVLAVNNQKAIVLNRDEQGRIAITMEIRDKDGRVVVLFENGRFVVNENNFLKIGTERPDRSTLIVHDQWNNEVLNARYRNASYLELSALLQYPGAKPLTIPKNFPASICLGDVGSVAININAH